MVLARRPAEPPTTREHLRLIGKIGVSLLLFWAAFGLSSLLKLGSQADLLWSIGASLFVAGIAFLAQYLIDVEKRLGDLNRKFDDHIDQTSERLDQHAHTTEQQMADGLAKIHLATELFDLREVAPTNPVDLAPMISLVQGYAKISRGSAALLASFAQAELVRLSGYLKVLGEGSDLSYEGEDRDWLLGLTKATQSSLCATSLSTVDAGGQSFTDGGLWRSELGLRYLDEQKRAIERGVHIQRIFIVDRPELQVSSLHEVLDQHVRIGVDVRVLNAPPAPGLLRLTDFIIFDDVLLYKSHAGTPVAGVSPFIDSTALVTNREQVGARKREFLQVWNADKVLSVQMGPENKLEFAPVSEQNETSGVDLVPLATTEDILDSLDNG